MRKDLDIQIEPYVNLMIFEADRTPEGYTNRETRRVVWEFQMPRPQYNRSGHRIQWIHARFQYFNPRLSYSTELSFYDKKTGLDLLVGNALSKVSTAKAQVTKQQNAIEEYAKRWQPTPLTQTIDADPTYKAALQKLETKIAELDAAEKNLKSEIEKRNQP